MEVAFYQFLEENEFPVQLLTMGDYSEFVFALPCKTQGKYIEWSFVKGATASEPPRIYCRSKETKHQNLIQVAGRSDVFQLCCDELQAGWRSETTSRDLLNIVRRVCNNAA